MGVVFSAVHKKTVYKEWGGGGLGKRKGVDTPNE